MSLTRTARAVGAAASSAGLMPQQRQFTLPLWALNHRPRAQEPQPNQRKGKAAAMEKTRREQQLLENAVPVGEVVSRVLVCELTLDEQRERGAELAGAMTAERDLAAEKKEVLNNFKAREQQLAIKTGQLHQVVETRREFREVDCHEYHDYKAGKVYVVRDDLGTIPETRLMTASERQRQLPAAIAERAMDQTAAQLDLKKAGETKTDDNTGESKKKNRQTSRAAAAPA